MASTSQQVGETAAALAAAVPDDLDTRLDLLQAPAGLTPLDRQRLLLRNNLVSARTLSTLLLDRRRRPMPLLTSRLPLTAGRPRCCPGVAGPRQAPHLPVNQLKAVFASSCACGPVVTPLVFASAAPNVGGTTPSMPLMEAFCQTLVPPCITCLPPLAEHARDVQQPPAVPLWRPVHVCTLC